MSTTATTRILHTPANASVVAELRSWIWPLPRLDGVVPRIIQPAESSAMDGVKIGYRERSSSPGLVPVFAAQAGAVTYAGTTERGSMLCLDHAGGWSTQYSGLEHLLTRPTDAERQLDLPSVLPQLEMLPEGFT